MQKEDLLEIANELVCLRFFMATALSTLPKGKNTAITSERRMQRLAQLEEKLRTAARRLPDGQTTNSN